MVIGGVRNGDFTSARVMETGAADRPTSIVQCSVCVSRRSLHARWTHKYATLFAKSRRILLWVHSHNRGMSQVRARPFMNTSPSPKIRG